MLLSSGYNGGSICLKLVHIILGFWSREEC